MTNFLLFRPLPLALIGAHYWPYAFVAIGVVMFRLFRKKVRPVEWMLLLAFVVFVGIEFVQLSVDGRSFLNIDFYGVDRYFGVFSPFLWIFAAKGVSSVWERSWEFSQDSLLPVGKLAVCMGLAWVLLKDNVGLIWNYSTQHTAYDTAVAVEQIVPVIREDYLGLSKQPVIRRSLSEYYTGKRPLVSCPYSAAGWAVRGDSCGATGAKCPYSEDYLFFPLGGGYGGITNIDVKIYKFIKQVPGGLGTQWMLFRRRTTPGKKW